MTEKRVNREQHVPTPEPGRAELMLRVVEWEELTISERDRQIFSEQARSYMAAVATTLTLTPELSAVLTRCAIELPPACLNLFLEWELGDTNRSFRSQIACFDRAE